MLNLQPALCGGNGAATDLQIVLSESSESILVFLGTAVLERIRCSREALQYKMLIGRLVNAGWSLNALQSTFHHDARTMKRWAAALLSEDIEFMVRAFSGRGADGKLTPAMVRYVKRRYCELHGVVRHYRQLIGSEVAELFGKRLSVETLRKLFREADRDRLSREHERAADSSGAPIMAAGCGCEPCPTVAPEPTRNQSPEVATATLPVLADTARASRPVGVHHAGMMLFALVLDLFCRRRLWAMGLQTQWLGQILQGAVNIEQSRLISAADLSRFTGPVLAGTDPQREALRAVAGLEAVMDVYAANARLLRDGPGRGRVFYYDPHSKEYTGGLKLLKGWCGRRHGVTKVLHVDMIHSESGRPCFAQHYSPYYDLRERFFMTLALFDRLFDADRRSGRLFVLDRGIYGLDVFRCFGQDHVLTWEKGYKGDGWQGQRPEVVFSRARPRNHAGDLMHYRFECREEPWRRDRSMRRILVRATNPKGNVIHVSILCSDAHLPIDKAAWLMFNRWLQENDFKYLDRHFGLNQLTSYNSKAVDELAGELRDMPVDSPEYKELKQQQRQAETDLARLLVKREDAQDRLAQLDETVARLKVRGRSLVSRLRLQLYSLDRPETAAKRRLHRQSDRLLQASAELTRELDKARSARRRLQRKLHDTETAIIAAKERRDQLEGQLCEAVRQKSRLRLLVDNHYRMLDTRCKEMLDALRITASNMFADLITVFRPIYGDYRNDHVMLRNLTRADGFLHRLDGTLHVRLWLKGRFQPRQLKAFHAFLAQMSERISASRPHAQPAVRIALIETPPTW